MRTGLRTRTCGTLTKNMLIHTSSPVTPPWMTRMKISIEQLVFSGPMPSPAAMVVARPSFPHSASCHTPAFQTAPTQCSPTRPWPSRPSMTSRQEKSSLLLTSLLCRAASRGEANCMTSGSLIVIVLGVPLPLNWIALHQCICVRYLTTNKTKYFRLRLFYEMSERRERAFTEI